MELFQNLKRWPSDELCGMDRLSSASSNKVSLMPAKVPVSVDTFKLQSFPRDQGLTLLSAISS
jgi:hypothetical protein